VSFPKQVFLTCGSICAVSAYPLATYGTGEVQKAALAGGIIATVNILAGYAAIRYSIGRSMNTFMKYVLGGMGLRLAAMTGALVALVMVYGFHAVALVASLGVFYLAYLVLEIAFIQRSLGMRQDG
jgi:hypothetical protein